MSVYEDIKKRYETGEIVGIYPSPYDKRDYKFKELIPLGAIKIPEEYESPNLYVFDQGDTNMCGACSFSILRYMQEKDQSNIKEPFSPAFTYANRLPGEEFEGMYLRSICKKGLEGVVPYHEFPGFYSFAKCKKEFTPRKDELLEKASNFKITKYYKCNSREQIQTAIITTKAVMVGVYVYDSLMKPNSRHIIEYDPKKDIKSYGGHCVLLVGWRIINGNFYWILHNSWGSDYGKDGRVYLPENYPWTEEPFAVVDDDIEVTYEEYNAKYNTKKIIETIKDEPKLHNGLGKYSFCFCNIKGFFKNLFKKG